MRRVFQLNLVKRAPRPGDKQKRTSITGNRPAIDALKSADIVIDLVGLLWSAEQNEITSTGTRMLMVREPFEVLERMFSTPESAPPGRSCSRDADGSHAAADHLCRRDRCHLPTRRLSGPHPVRLY